MSKLQSKEFRIDLKKTASLANADLYFRMMVAMNDLQSVQQLSGLITTNSLNVFTEYGLDSYTNRMLQSHVAEACNTFVEKIRPRRNENPCASYVAIQQDSAAFAAFNALVGEMYEINPADGAVTTRTDPDGSIHYLSKKYEQLKLVRDTVGFHYNDQSTHYQASLAALKSAFEKYNQNDPVGLVLDEKRYPVDSLATTACLVAAGINDLSKSIDDDNPEYVAFRDYTGNLMKLLVTYLLKTVNNWLDKNSLLARCSQ